MSTDEFGQELLTTCAGRAFGFHWECSLPKLDDQGQPTGWCCCGGVDWSDPMAKFEAEQRAERRGGGKPMSEMRDTRSTGRKRAAMLYQIMPGMVCEWAGLRFAVAGAVEMIGCDYNLIWPDTKEGHGGDLHHGVDKSTMNNSPGNVHRICKSCHNRVHALTNPLYPGDRPKDGSPWLPEVELYHDPYTQASRAQIELANKSSTATNEKASEGQIAGLWADRKRRQKVAQGLADDPSLL